MNIEKKLQDYILTKYDSVTDFCVKSGIASSTVFTVFKRGINNSSTNTIMKICNALSLDVQALTKNEIREIEYVPNENTLDISEILYQLETKSISLTYKGMNLTEKQRHMIAFTAKCALQLALKEDE